MSKQSTLRAIPVDDRAWLLAGLGDALQGGCPVLALGPAVPPDEVQRLREAELPAGTAVLIRTSGSSGVPKTVALSAQALLSSARSTHEALGGPGQWLVTLPTHLISGVQMLVRSSVAGTEPVFFDGSFDPAAFLAAAERMDHDRRYVSLVPVQLARLLDLAVVDQHAADVMRAFSAVLVGGQSTPLPLRQQAHELGVTLRRSYGMTETAGGCVYDGVEIGDTQVRIREGEVQLAGSCLAIGYVADEALSADRFVVDGGTRWYRTGDAGNLLGGMLTVTGRIDRVIISGGVNVSLDEVERVVREVPGWASAVAMSAPHPEWGERVALVREWITAEPGDSEAAEATQATAISVASGATQAAVTFDELRDIVKASLGAAAEPLWVNETEKLPRLPGGKPDLQAIEAWVVELRRSFAQLRAATDSPQAPGAPDGTSPAATSTSD